jgi:hypothetical protein
MDPAVLSHIRSSNLPPSEKGAIMRFVSSVGQRARRGFGSISSYVPHSLRTAHRNQLVSTAEGLGVGAILGVLHVELPQGLDVKGKVPIDAVAAGALTLGSMAAAASGNTDLAHHTRVAAIAAAAGFGFRKGVDLMSEMKRKKGLAPGGTVGQRRAALPAASHHGDVDPLAEFARGLG